MIIWSNEAMVAAEGLACMVRFRPPDNIERVVPLDDVRGRNSRERSHGDSFAGATDSNTSRAFGGRQPWATM
jgi:hypothetical protein